MEYYFIATRMVGIKKTDHVKQLGDYRRTRSHSNSKCTKQYNHFRKLAVSCKVKHTHTYHRTQFHFQASAFKNEDQYPHTHKKKETNFVQG